MAVVLLGLFGSNAVALSLGRITVRSALGEPLRAEVDIPDINVEESASLKVSLAMPEAFRAAAMDYNPALSSLQLTIQKRSDGQTFIRLSSDRIINDPFVDLILQATWSNGRIVRDYTMLFDPPNLRQTPPPSASTAPVTTQAAAARAAAPATLAPAAPTPTRARATAEEVPKKTIKQPTTVTRVAAPPVKEVARVNVKMGDTASKIALSTKPTRVSLDQMLVALLRANPTAFIDGNVNRLKAGAVVNIPTSEQALATPAPEATQLIVAQSTDFNDFRRRFAQNAPRTPVAVADRQVSGAVQAKVEDKKPVTTTPDRLTLSKGTLKAQQAEDQMTKERSAKEAAGRAAELAKNISELRQLGAASSAVAPAPVTAAASPPLAGPTIAASPTAAASTVLTPVAASVPPQLPASVASTPSTKVAESVIPVGGANTPPPDVSLVDELIENPGVPLGAAGLIALLAGFGVYLARQRKQAAQADSVFLQSHLKPDSFFGASGGQSVDTSNETAGGSSLVYSPSQLDAVDDVDPVAEADVYLAYGRDLQAEEILKDALRTNPGRIAIHHKFLDIFAKRRELDSFENIATLAYKVTGGEGTEWGRICALGQSVDPGNALYQPGGQPSEAQDEPSKPASDASAVTLAAIAPAIEGQHAGPGDLDLDLDFSLDEEAIRTVIEPATSSLATSPSTTALDIDFDLDAHPPQPVTVALGNLPELARAASQTQALAPSSMPAPLASADFSDSDPLPGFSLTLPAPAEDEDPEAAQPPASTTGGMLDFDFESLSLDLAAPVADPEPISIHDTQQDPMATKLELAQEFVAIGDKSGARALIEEVIAEASGDVRTKAQHALKQL